MSEAEMFGPQPVLEGATPTAPSKLDPETLTLRARPTPVARFRRGAIVGLSAAAAMTIVGAAWVALKPPTFSMVAESEQGHDAGAARPADVLTNAPTSYAEVPRLGPPLPGDLGRPILERQRELAGSDDPDGQRAAQQAGLERQRLTAERKAARESGLIVPSQVSAMGNASVSPSSNPDGAPAAAEEREGRLALQPDRDPNAQRRKLDFLNQTDDGGDVNPHTLQRAASPWVLSAGSVIAASLVTGLSSDLPGMVVAQVTENAYDSVTGRTLLIPQGARLVGSYDSVVAFGQKRALLVWQRIILPDGSSIRIDNVPATDAAGYAGLADKVDFHSWALLKGAAMATLLGVGTELSSGSGESDLVRAIRESTQQNADRAGQQITSKNLDIQPTITVRPGWPLRVVVHKDLVLAPWKS